MLSSVQTIYRLGTASEILARGKTVHHTEPRALEVSQGCRLKLALSLDADEAFAVLGCRVPGEVSALSWLKSGS